MENKGLQIVAQVFADAKDAPTSFEDQEWLEGFEQARCMIAVRISETLEKAGLIESASAFLDDCGIPEDGEAVSLADAVRELLDNRSDDYLHADDRAMLAKALESGK